MDIDISKIKIGDRVCYQPSHYEEDKWENGMVKELSEHTNTSLRVVYNCASDWDNFKNYTSALTDVRDLKLGWKFNNGNTVYTDTHAVYQDTQKSLSGKKGVIVDNSDYPYNIHVKLEDFNAPVGFSEFELSHSPIEVYKNENLQL